MSIISKEAANRGEKEDLELLFIKEVKALYKLIAMIINEVIKY